jgi:hypothetical protein
MQGRSQRPAGGDREEEMTAAVQEGARAGGDAGLGLRAGFIGARRPEVWQVGASRDEEAHRAGTHP